MTNTLLLVIVVVILTTSCCVPLLSVTSLAKCHLAPQCPSRSARRHCKTNKSEVLEAGTETESSDASPTSEWFAFSKFIIKLLVQPAKKKNKKKNILYQKNSECSEHSRTVKLGRTLMVGRKQVSYNHRKGGAKKKNNKKSKKIKDKTQQKVPPRRKKDAIKTSKLRKRVVRRREKVVVSRVVGRMAAAAKTARQIKMARKVTKMGARGRKWHLRPTSRKAIKPSLLL